MLLFGAVQSVLSVISFTAILWNLSGTLKLFGVSMPRAMFWILIVYVLIATIVGFWIGRPLIRLTFNNESSTPRSATPWCGCATPPRRSPSTGARSPNGGAARAVRAGRRQL